MANKKWLVTGAVIIAGAIAFVALRGPRVATTGTEGTIGAANRYQSDQITAQDVTLDNPEMAAFIQTDTFRKVAADPALREAFRSEALNVVLGSEGLRKKADAVAAVVGSEAARKYIGSDQGRATIESGIFKNADIRELASGRAEAMRWLDAYSGTARNDAMRKLYADAATIRSADALRKLAGERGIAKDAELAKMLSDGYTGKAVEAGAHTLLALDQARLAQAMEALRTPAFVEAAKIEGLQSVIEGAAGNQKTVDALAAVASDQALVSAMQNRYVLEAARYPEFARLAESNRMTEALAVKVSE